LTPGLEYEIGLSEKTKVNLRLGTGFGIFRSNNKQNMVFF